MAAIVLATLNVNIGANVVSPANDFSNLWPRRISFRTGGVITCVMGIALMPWKLLSNYKTFILGWLGGYAAFLGPVAGMADLCLGTDAARGRTPARRGIVAERIRGAVS